MRACVPRNSLCNVLWSLWVGRPVYADLSAATVGRGVGEGTLRPDIPPDMAPEYARVLAHCWEYDAARRPSARELTAELREAVAAVSRRTGIPTAPVTRQSRLL